MLEKKPTVIIVEVSKLQIRAHKNVKSPLIG